MGKALAANRDRQLVHIREVGLAQPPRYVVLRKEHFAARPCRRAPALEMPLQRTQLPVGEFARVLALQRLEDRLGFQSRMRIDLLFDLLPDSLKRIQARAPSPFGLLLAGLFAAGQIFPRRLHVHAGFGGRHLLCLLGFRQPSQPPHLCVCDHLARARGRNLRWSLMVAVDREF